MVPSSFERPVFWPLWGKRTPCLVKDGPKSLGQSVISLVEVTPRWSHWNSCFPESRLALVLAPGRQLLRGHGLEIRHGHPPFGVWPGRSRRSPAAGARGCTALPPPSPGDRAGGRPPSGSPGGSTRKAWTTASFSWVRRVQVEYSSTPPDGHRWTRWPGSPPGSGAGLPRLQGPCTGSPVFSAGPPARNRAHPPGPRQRPPHPSYGAFSPSATWG